MAEVTERGKRKDNALQGTVRIEYDNDRIVFTAGGVVIAEYASDHTSYFDPATGGEVMRMGKLLDDKYGVSWFDPATGRELMRAGIMPDDSAAWVTAKDGETVEDIYA